MSSNKKSSIINPQQQEAAGQLEQPLLLYYQEETPAAIATPTTSNTTNTETPALEPSAPPIDFIPVAEAVVAQQVIRDDITAPLDGNIAQRGFLHQQIRRDVRRKWKDGIFNCCAHGCCHPSLICPLCCPLIAIGQIMGRLDLNLAGRRGSKFQSKLTFVFLCTVACFVYYFGTADCISSYVENYIHEHDYYWLQYLLPSSFATLLLFYLIVVTRRYIRKKDEIPPACCSGCDDCCAAAVFPCCAISQMMRHTANYNVYRAVWISRTGLPDGVILSDDGEIVEP